MEEFELDPALHDTLRGVRESVRRLFEQLRLRHEDGDISGKERLERVPALAKHNFRNLGGPSAQLAIKEAWRLVDFLEGGGGEARLSLRAREALRAIELDRQLAVFRSSDRWKQATERLRDALDNRRGVPQCPAATTPSEKGSEPAHDPENAGKKLAPVSGKSRWPIYAMLSGGVVLAGAIVVTTVTPGTLRSDPARACVAQETASTVGLTTHRRVYPPPPVAGAPVRPSGEQRVLIAQDGEHVASTWTSSVFSFEEGGSRRGKGGGLSDIRLRVGGWGDTYVSLLRFNLPDDRLAYRATLQLIPLGETASFRRTSMTLRAIDAPWAVPAGPGHRLWWADCPQSEAIATNLPPPREPGIPYRVDITLVYNNWVSGQQPNYGIMLEPEQIGRGDHGIFNTFHSSRARLEENRPRIIVEY